MSQSSGRGVPRPVGLTVDLLGIVQTKDLHMDWILGLGDWAKPRRGATPKLFARSLKAKGSMLSDGCILRAAVARRAPGRFRSIPRCFFGQSSD